MSVSHPAPNPSSDHSANVLNAFLLRPAGGTSLSAARLTCLESYSWRQCDLTAHRKRSTPPVPTASTLHLCCSVMRRSACGG